VRGRASKRSTDVDESKMNKNRGRVFLTRKKHLRRKGQPKLVRTQGEGGKSRIQKAFCDQPAENEEEAGFKSKE